MIHLHLKDGRTIPIDLDDGDNEWLKKLARPDFQEMLTAVTVKMMHPNKTGEVGVQYSVVRPRGFDDTRQWFQIERVEEKGRIRGGERLDLFIGDVRVSLMAHTTQPACRVSVTKIGRRIFGPNEADNSEVP